LVNIIDVTGQHPRSGNDDTAAEGRKEGKELFSHHPNCFDNRALSRSGVWFHSLGPAAVLVVSVRREADEEAERDVSGMVII
jgi:hypothetical protein